MVSSTVRVFVLSLVSFSGNALTGRHSSLVRICVQRFLLPCNGLLNLGYPPEDVDDIMYSRIESLRRSTTPTRFNSLPPG